MPPWFTEVRALFGHAWPQHCQVARVRCARSSGHARGLTVWPDTHLAPRPTLGVRGMLVLGCRSRGSGNPSFYSISCIFEELLLQSCLWIPFCYFSWGTKSLQKLVEGSNKR